MNTDQALQGAFSQLRFIFFAYFISTLSINPKNLEKIFQFTLIILFIVSLDTLLQFFTGKDIFGFTGDPLNPARLSGPFGDELIVGAYLTFILIPLLPYYIKFFNEHSKRKNFLLCFLSL